MANHLVLIRKAQGALAEEGVQCGLPLAVALKLAASAPWSPGQRTGYSGGGGVGMSSITLAWAPLTVG